MANRISDYSTIPASVFSGRTTQLNDFVEKLQLDLFDSADKVRSSLSDAEKVREYAQKMKSEFIKRLGGVPFVHGCLVRVRKPYFCSARLQ